MWPDLSLRRWSKPPRVLRSNLRLKPSHLHTSLHMTGIEWEAGVGGWRRGLQWCRRGGSGADGGDSHVLRDSRGGWRRWQATHSVLFTVWVCSLSVTSECCLATALITAFRGAANWKWNCGWALRQAQAMRCGKCYLRTVGYFKARFVIVFPRRKSWRCVWRFSMYTQAELNVSSCPESQMCTHWAGNQAICPGLTFVWFVLNVYHRVRFLF